MWVVDAERAEVDPELVGRAARLGKLPGIHDDAHAHVDALEVGPVDGHARRLAIGQAI